MSNEAPTDALRLVPVEPTEAVLTNMAIRFDHGLGCPRYYDNPIFGEPSHARRFEAAKTTMRQLYEEVVLSGAAPASPLPGGGWQDISTAPKDGTVVDLFYPERGRLTDATWGPTGWGRHEWRGSHTVRMIPSEKPTHWMPFPAAPTGDA